MTPPKIQTGYCVRITEPLNKVYQVHYLSNTTGIQHVYSTEYTPNTLRDGVYPTAIRPSVKTITLFYNTIIYEVLHHYHHLEGTHITTTTITINHTSGIRHRLASTQSQNNNDDNSKQRKRRNRNGKIHTEI